MFDGCSFRSDSMQALVDMLDRSLGAICLAARWLALPLVLLLFLQWPLRDLYKGWSREANDLGQCVFALYVAVSLTAATRSGAHLASDALAHRHGERLRRALEAGLILLGLLPWSLFLLIVGWPALLTSLRGLEAFPDTGNPGYFLIRASGFLLAALVFASGLLGLLRRRA